MGNLDEDEIPKLRISWMVEEVLRDCKMPGGSVMLLPSTG